MAKVAFLGLGAMGSRMAKNVVAAGFDVAVWNRSEAAGKALADVGARTAKSPKDAVEGADVAIAMLTDDKASERVWTSAGSGALAGMKAGAVAVEMSTLTPAWIAELAERAWKKGVKLLDAPVSGSLPQAEGRQLIVMAGGDTDAFAVAKPVLAAMGTPHHVGPNGHGALFKLAVNALLGIQLAGWAELLGFLKKNGVDVAQALNLMATTSLASPAGVGFAKLMAAHDYAPRFTTSLLAKDLRYLHATAAGAGSETPMTDAASAVLEAASKLWSSENVTAVGRRYGV